MSPTSCGPGPPVAASFRGQRVLLLSGVCALLAVLLMAAPVRAEKSKTCEYDFYAAVASSHCLHVHNDS